MTAFGFMPLIAALSACGLSISRFCEPNLKSSKDSVFATSRYIIGTYELRCRPSIAARMGIGTVVASRALSENDWSIQPVVYAVQITEIKTAPRRFTVLLVGLLGLCRSLGSVAMFLVFLGPPQPIQVKALLKVSAS